MIRICEINLGNPKTRNWFRYEIFIHLFEFKAFSRWGESDTFFLYWQLLHRQLSTQPTPLAHKVVWPRPGLNLNSLVRTQELNSLLFTSLGLISIWDFYFDLYEWHILSARAWTPALMLHLTNPCAKRKVLCLTKPKGKLYKTKSPRNYITPVPRAPFTIDFTATFMFHSFFNSLTSSRYLFILSLSFSFTLGSAGIAKFSI